MEKMEGKYYDKSSLVQVARQEHFCVVHTSDLFGHTLVKGACTTNLRAMDIFAILGTGLEVGGQLAKETFYLVNGFMKAADSPVIEGQMKCKICATCLQKETFCNFFLW